MVILEHKAGRDDRAQLMTTLSVYLVLLAFFLLLNNLSQVEIDRSGAAINSVREALRLKALPKRGDPLPSSAALLSARDDVARAFRSALPEAASLPMRGGDAVRLAVAPARLFLPSSARLQPSLETALGELARATAGGPPDTHIAVALQLPLDSAQGGLAAARAAAFAAAAYRQGVPAEALSVTVAPFAGGQAELTLSVEARTDGP